MAQISVFIPQIGEGLQEARLVGILKKAGEKVKRDEPIYQMETDKAVMDVESPFDGVIIKWTAEVDSILPIGGEVAVMEVTEYVAHSRPEVTTSESEGETSPMTDINAKSEGAERSGMIPPRTRNYAKEKGLTDDQLNSLAGQGKKVMPEDIDAFLASSSHTIGDKAFEETAMAPKQRLLSSRLMRSNSLVVPGTISVAVNWEPIESERARAKTSGSDFQPSSFTMFSYCVVQSLAKFPMFRSILMGEDKVRTYSHVHLGIAVGLPGDELVIAAVPDADTLGWTDFAKRMREKIELARTGQDQASESVTVSLTNMQAFGLRDAVPVVAAPSVATIFLGEVYNALDPSSSEIKMKRMANMSMTFDHRLINGVGAANFFADIKQRVETISTSLVEK